MLSLGVEYYFYYANNHEKTTIPLLKCLMINELLKNTEIPPTTKASIFQPKRKIIIEFYVKRQH
jgi:hypothetical protein